MSFRATTLKRSRLVLGFLALATVSGMAQVPDSPIVFAQSAIITTLVQAPNLGGGGGNQNSDADTQWLKVEFHYGVIPPNGGAFLDSAEFRVWIEGRDLYAPEATTKDGIPIALTGTVTYVALPATHDAYGVFYIPPATLDRFSTTRGTSDFDRLFNIHIEAYINGTKVDYFDKNKEQDGSWYMQLKPLTGYVYRQDHCPFIMTDPDRYPPIKLPPTMIAQ